MSNVFKAGALALAIGLAVAGSASAAGVRSLILGGDPQGKVDAARIDLIGSDGRFDQAGSASLALSESLPTLSYLQQFDSVLIWTNFVPSDTTYLSNLLADYVDSGGGVVIGTFWGQQVDHLGLGGGGGRLNDTGYNPLTNPTYDAYNAHTLGAFNASDPLMQGVLAISSNGFNSDYAAGLDGGATLAASWDDGRPLAAYSASHKVAAITLFPSVASFGHASGDYARLFGNALVFTAGPAAISAAPEPATWAMMLIGFGGLGANLRANRRRRAAATA